MKFRGYYECMNLERENSVPKVLIIQDVEGKNLLPARDHGEIEVILTGKEEKLVAYGRLADRISMMRRNDFLLLIGNPIYIGIAMHVALTLLRGKINVLVWDRK